MAILRTLTQRFTGPWRAPLPERSSAAPVSDVAAQWRQIINHALDETRVLPLEDPKDLADNTRPLMRTDLLTLVAISEEGRFPAGSQAEPRTLVRRPTKRPWSLPLSDQVQQHPQRALALLGFLLALNVLQLLLHFTR